MSVLGQSLCQSIGDHFGGGQIFQFDVPIRNCIPHIMVSDGDMFAPIMVFRVLCQVDPRLAVCPYRRDIDGARIAIVVVWSVIRVRRLPLKSRTFLNKLPLILQRLRDFLIDAS